MAKEFVLCGTCRYWEESYLCKLMPRWVSKEGTSGCYSGEVKEVNDG